MFVALSKFVVANELTASVIEAFKNRPHLVDSEPGFVRLEVLCPEDEPREIWLLTHWQDEGSFRAWHRGHNYHNAHRGMPKGLKLVPKATELRFFRQICS